MTAPIYVTELFTDSQKSVALKKFNFTSAMSTSNVSPRLSSLLLTKDAGWNEHSQTQVVTEQGKAHGNRSAEISGVSSAYKKNTVNSQNYRQGEIIWQ